MITSTEITLDGQHISSTEAMVRGDAAAYATLRRELATRPLRAPPANVVVLQADASTDVAAINAIVRAAQQSGRAVLFAVKNR